MDLDTKTLITDACNFTVYRTCLDFWGEMLWSRREAGCVGAKALYRASLSWGREIMAWEQGLAAHCSGSNCTICSPSAELWELLSSQRIVGWSWCKDEGFPPQEEGKSTAEYWGTLVYSDSPQMSLEDWVENTSLLSNLHKLCSHFLRYCCHWWCSHSACSRLFWALLHFLMINRLFA